MEGSLIRGPFSLGEDSIIKMGANPVVNNVKAFRIGQCFGYVLLFKSRNGCQGFYALNEVFDQKTSVQIAKALVQRKVFFKQRVFF